MRGARTGTNIDSRLFTAGGKNDSARREVQPFFTPPFAGLQKAATSRTIFVV